jgi:hypothetical protein
MPSPVPSSGIERPTAAVSAGVVAARSVQGPCTPPQTMTAYLANRLQGDTLVALRQGGNPPHSTAAPSGDGWLGGLVGLWAR